MTAPEFLPFALPDIGEAEIAAVVETLRSGWITTGARTRQFEAEFAAYTGAKHALAVNSCTAALHLALEAVGVKRDDEVLVPTVTFAATAEVVRYVDAKPVLVDCRADDLTMDVEQAAAAVTPRTKAIIPVHYSGTPCEMDAILALAKRHGLAVIEDAAHALPTEYQGRKVGTIGDITCFSFYATKTVTTGEGGMITTANDAWADRMRVMCLHGISKDAWKRYTASGSWYYEIMAPGYKYNLTDIASAIGIHQLRRCEEMWRRRRELAISYREAFGQLEELELPAERPGTRHAWHLFPIRLRLEKLAINRAAFMDGLREAGIGASVHFIPLHLHPYYRDTYGCQPPDCPVATREYERLVSLPLYSKMTAAEARRVVAAVSGLVTKGRLKHG
ncbi:MAG: DegT/DnrJ/EryC1/StrS family aminotransferase [bacterium]